MESMNFCDRLKEAMAAKGFKQVDVLQIAAQRGQKLGKSQLSQYVSGKTIPRPDMLAFLAEALEVSEDWLRATSDKTEPHAKEAQISQDKIEPDAAEDARSLITNQAEESARPAQQEVRTMKRFEKSSKLNHVSYDVRGPALDEAMRMEEDGIHILKLNIGNPAPFGFRTPDEVVQDLASQLRDTEGYSDSRGLFAARKAIMQYDQLKNIPNVTMNDIYTGNGVSDLINMVMQAMVETGDEILVPSPDYPLWTACVTLAGGKAVHYLCDEQAEWLPDIADIRSKVTSNTKAIVIINPNNPTGALYPKEVLEEIVQIARENQLILLSDEIYDRLVMDGEEHVSIASLAPDLFCITFNGLSKSHMIAGWRIGWISISGNKRLGRGLMEGINMMSNMRLCSNVPAQSIVQTALGGHQSVKGYVVPGGRVRNQRDFVYERLCQIDGVSVVKPKAAFYIFPRLDPKKFNITDDEQFQRDLLQDKRVLIVPGKGFNWETPGYFRIVYLPRRAILGEALDAIEDFLSYYRQ
jgi:alanine-synthesizing transaminase